MSEFVVYGILKTDSKNAVRLLSCTQIEAKDIIGAYYDNAHKYLSADKRTAFSFDDFATMWYTS